MHRTLLSCLLLGCGFLAACSHSGSDEPGKAASAPAASSSSKGNRAQSVSTTRSRAENVPLILEAQGNVVALDEVDIRPQKNGMITEIHFREGQELKRGQLMFTLDARDDEANIAKLTAAQQGAEAGVQIAQRDLARNKELSERQFISPSALDTSRNKLDTASANLEQARAALQQARVSQGYTRIVAPFDGRAGVINVRPGSLVTSSQTSTALVHLTRMDPIGVSFTIAERDVPALLAALRAGKVALDARTATGAKLKGEVSFVDSAVDRASGMLLVKGKLDNHERLAWPGQYLTVRVAAGETPDAVVLPAQALVTGPNGRLVYEVKDDQTVESHPVELVRIFDQRAIITGIPGGMKVVLEGAQNLRPGTKVQEVEGNGGKGGGKRHRQAEGSAPAAGAEKQ